MDDIKTQFNNISRRYDSQRKLLIPCFDDFYAAAYPLVKQLQSPARLLDIGAGTGLFSYFIYEQLPQLDFTLLDISDAMLQVARQRFEGLPNFHFIEADFAVAPLTGKYDIVISALAIHHLEDAEKVNLYRNVFDVLNPGGIFINADQVSGRTPLYVRHAH